MCYTYILEELVLRVRGWVKKVLINTIHSPSLGTTKIINTVYQYSVVHYMVYTASVFYINSTTLNHFILDRNVKNGFFHIYTGFILKQSLRTFTISEPPTLLGTSTDIYIEEKYLYLHISGRTIYIFLTHQRILQSMYLQIRDRDVFLYIVHMYELDVVCTLIFLQIFHFYIIPPPSSSW